MSKFRKENKSKPSGGASSPPPPPGTNPTRTAAAAAGRGRYAGCAAPSRAVTQRAARSAVAAAPRAGSSRSWFSSHTCIKPLGFFVGFSLFFAIEALSCSNPAGSTAAAAEPASCCCCLLPSEEAAPCPMLSSLPSKAEQQSGTDTRLTVHEDSSF